jgi:hypothetical protein
MFDFLKITQINMVSAMGSVVTRSEKNAFFYGLLLHFIAGILFSYFYLLGAAYLGFESTLDFVLYGTLIGSFHGVFFSIATVILVAEHHPIKRYRKSGFKVVAVHGCAHVIFGCTLGLAAALLDPNLRELAFFAHGVR